MGTYHLVMYYMNWLRLISIEIIVCFRILRFQRWCFRWQLLHRIFTFLYLMIRGLMRERIVLIYMIGTKVRSISFEKIEQKVFKGRKFFYFIFCKLKLFGVWIFMILLIIIDMHMGLTNISTTHYNACPMPFNAVFVVAGMVWRHVSI